MKERLNIPELKRAIIFPAWKKKESDVHFYPLNEMKNIEIADKGGRAKTIFKGDKEDRHVQILTRKREELIKAIQQALESTGNPFKIHKN